MHLRISIKCIVYIKVTNILRCFVRQNSLTLCCHQSRTQIRRFLNLVASFFIGEETAFVHEDGDKPGAGGPSSKSGVLDTCFGVWMGFSAFRFLAALDLRHGVLVAGFSFLLFGVGSCFFFLVF